MYYTRLYELESHPFPSASAVGEIVLSGGELEIACQGIFAVSQQVFSREIDPQDLDDAWRVYYGLQAAIEHRFAGAVILGRPAVVDRVARILSMTQLGWEVEEHTRTQAEYMAACAGTPTPLPDALHIPMAWIGNRDISKLLPPNAYVFDAEATSDPGVSSPADRLTEVVWKPARPELVPTPAVTDITTSARPEVVSLAGLAYMYDDNVFEP